MTFAHTELHYHSKLPFVDGANGNFYEYASIDEINNVLERHLGVTISENDVLNYQSSKERYYENGSFYFVGGIGDSGDDTLALVNGIKRNIDETITVSIIILKTVYFDVSVSDDDYYMDMYTAMMSDKYRYYTSAQATFKPYSDNMRFQLVSMDYWRYW